MRKILMVLLVISLTVCAGCNTQYNDKINVDNAIGDLVTDTVVIYDANSNIKTELELSSKNIRYFADDYAIFFQSEISSDNSVKVHNFLYNVKNNSVKELITTTNDSIASDKVYINDRVYMLLTYGKESAEKLPTGEIWYIDVKTAEMRKVVDVGEVSPTSIMSRVGNKILFGFLTYKGHTIAEYDTVSGKYRELKKLAFNNKKVAGIGPVKISATKNEIVFLLLDYLSLENFSLRAEVYDYSYNKVRSFDVGFISDNPDELRTTVKTFEIIGDLIYYRNDSSTIYFGDCENRKLKINERIVELKKAREQSLVENNHLFYALEGEQLCLYLYDSKAGILKVVKPEFAKHCISASVFRNDNDEIWITMSSVKSGKGLTTEAYCDSLSAFDFYEIEYDFS